MIKFILKTLSALALSILASSALSASETIYGTFGSDGGNFSQITPTGLLDPDNSGEDGPPPPPLGNGEVPEPAAFALIFASLALGLTLLRRNK